MTNRDRQDELLIDSLNLSLPTILEKIILGGIIFILALPLIGDYGLTLFPIGRDIIFKLSIEFLIFLYFALWLIKSRHTIYPPTGDLPQGVNIQYTKALLNPITLFMLVFWAVMALATLFSVQQSFSFWGNIYKNQGLLTWSHYIIFFILLVTFVRDKKSWGLLINTAILIGMVVGLISLWQMLKNGFTSMPSATLNNSNYLAAYLVLLIPVTLAFFLRKKSYFLGAALVLQAIALFATQTRGAYLGIITALFIFAFLYLKYKKFVIITPILLVAFYLMLALTPASQYIRDKFPPSVRFLNIQSMYNSGGPRLEAWKAGWHAMLNKPILGYGPENFFVGFDEFYSGSQDHNGSLAIEGSLWESWFDKAHNFIFDIGVTTGFLGLFAYIAIFASAIWLLYKKFQVSSFQPGADPPWADKFQVVNIGLISAFAGYLIQNLFGFDTTVPGVYLMFLLGYTAFLTISPGVSLRGLRPQSEDVAIQNKERLPRSLRTLAMTTLTLLIAIIFIISLKLHIDILSANYQLNLAEVLSRNGQLDRAFAAFEKGLKYNASPINPNLRRRYGVTALAYYDAVQSQCADKFDQKKCGEFSKDSKKYLARALELQKENATKEWPRFTRNYIYAAQISHILGNYEEADKFFEKSLELSPRRGSINTEWKRLLEARGK